MAPATSAPLDAESVVTIDEEAYDYVFDKGPLTDFRVGENGQLESLSSLRVFGLRKGYTEFGELPGHYVMNAWTGQVPVSVQCLEAPGLVHFKDCNLAPSFVMEWKFINDKLYAMVLATTVKVGNGGNPDKSDKWLSVADIRPVKLSLIYSVQPVQDRDGMPLQKNLNAWLAEHSGDRRKALSLTSIAAHRQWCCYGNFTKNFSTLSKSVHADFEKGIRNSKHSGPAAIEAAIAKKLPALLTMTASLEQHIKLISLPLTHRCIEVEIDPETELSELHDLLVKRRLVNLTKIWRRRNRCSR